ncbi:MAG TPA: ATP-dependent transcriptional regulator, partial [Sulfitobacter sp.]|nr:ATP-dependent transcriptional regulator [Sulfitobacter sp.]
MKKYLLLPLMLAISACVPASHPGVVTRAAMEPASTSSLPAMKRFTVHQSLPAPRSNNDLSLDFIELSFRMESGKELPVFTRFEGPVTVRVIGAPPPTLGPDLTALLNRLRQEARIDISPTSGPNANITVEAVSRRTISKVLPQAACFVAPNVSSLDEYKKVRRTAQTNWSLLKTRSRVSIFIPNDASPQEVRDCLHEELAQALG